jgi:hypothetical protein
MRIPLKCSKRIEKALKIANFRCRERIATADHLSTMAHLGEAEMDKLSMAQIDRKGFRVWNHIAVPNRYKYRACYTFVMIERGRHAWHLIECSRQWCRNEPWGTDEYRHGYSWGQRDGILKRFRFWNRPYEKPSSEKHQ